MNMQSAAPGPIAFAIVAALFLAPTVARSEDVGAAAAVKPSSTGTPPGGGTRALEIGAGIVSKERIQTTGSGSLQVMFVDKTTLTIGPNSDLVIDQFVYNANAGTGQFAANLTKGALRFVGGQISHTAGATINTPEATVGIRGGAAFITHDAVCQANQGKAGGHHGECTKVVCMGGTCTVKSLIDSRNLQLHISQAVEVGLGGLQPFSVSSVKLNELTKTGDATITSSTTQTQSTQANFQGQGTIAQTVSEQQPEPPAPSPPGP